MQRNTLNKTYRLFAQCIPVKGYNRSIIVDLGRNQIHLIPNSLYVLITRNKNKTLYQILKQFDKAARPVLLSYFSFLESHELIFPLEKHERNCFPELSLQWNTPTHCANAIIDITEKSKYDIKTAILKLSQIHCFHLQIRFFKIIDFSELESIVEFANSLPFQSIQLILAYTICAEKTQYSDFMKKYQRLAKIEVFNAFEDEIMQVHGLASIVIFHRKKLQHKNECGYIDIKYFSVDMKHFTEAQYFNTCLNKKISIDENGKIKNCPSMEQSFGNIERNSLTDIVKKEKFTKIWYIRKDDIEVCQDCEFRYICTDCRCFIRNPENIRSQPAKCGYNPYIGKWKDENEYIPVPSWKQQNPNWEKNVTRKPLIKETGIAN